MKTNTIFKLIASALLASQTPTIAAPPAFPQASSVVELPEGKGVGTSVFQAIAIDPDGDKIIYSVSPENHFTYIPGSDTLTVLRALDFETSTVHHLTLTATAENGETATQSLTINLTDDPEITANPSDLGTNHPYQRGEDTPTVTTRRFAVYLVRFKDADLSKFPGGANPVIPTKEEWHEILNGKLIQDYWHAQSWGQFSPTMDVFGYFDHPKRLDETGQDYPSIINEIGNLTIDDPDYDYDNYQHHVFLFINEAGPDWYAGAGAGLTSNLSINGTVHQWTKTILHGGYINRAGADRLTNQVSYAFINHLDQWEDGYNNYPLVRFQRTYLHEAAHSIGLQWHENSANNSGAPAWHSQLQPGITKDQINDEYGNPFALLGRSHFSMNITAAGRDKLGWSNATNRYSIKRPGKHTVRLQPINRTTGYRTIEVRIPHRINQFWEGSGTKNHGYLLEVREQDVWSSLHNPGIIKNTHGVLIHDTDGDGSRILDMSPSELLPSPWPGEDKLPDLRDLALKPGMTFRNHEVEFSNVVAHNDGSFSIDIEILERAGWETNAVATIEEFRTRHFGTNIATGNAADSADPDRDGLPNRMEHALGTDPTTFQPLSTALLTRKIKINDKIFIETEVKSSVAAEASTSLILETSTNLQTWNQVHFEVVSNIVAHNFDSREELTNWTKSRLVTYRSKFPIDQNNQLFWRLAAFE